MAIISIILDDCLKELGEIASSRVQRYENEVSQPRWLDELGRLRIWAGNTGALQCDQSSLEYRLRDASHLKNETSRILQRVLQIVRSLSDLLDEPEEDMSEDEAFMDLAGEELYEEIVMTDVQMLHQSLHNAISLLNQLSLEARKPAEHDLLLSVNVNDVSLLETWAQKHVSRNFPDLDETIVHRLSTAMTKQREVLHYRSQKPRRCGESDHSESTPSRRGMTENFQGGGGLDQLQFSGTPISESPQAPYPISAFSGHQPTSIPKPPESSTNNCPFECPYCGSLIMIQSEDDWAHHIFEDLMPYTCLSSDCITPFKLYESRSQWYHHMCEAHSVPSKDDVFSCPLCHDAYEPPVTFERHVGEHLEQLALFVLRTGSEHAPPDIASHTTSLEVSKDHAIVFSEPGTQEFSNERLAVETTDVGPAAGRSLEAAQQSDEPFKDTSKIHMAQSEDMSHIQMPKLPVDNDRNLSLSPELSSQAGQETGGELQDEHDDLLSSIGSLSPVEMDSPVDFDRELDCSPAPSSQRRVDRQAALDHYFSDLAHNLPRVSTASHTGPSEPPETNLAYNLPRVSIECHTSPSQLPETSRASPIYERGQNSPSFFTRFLNENQSRISDDLEVDRELQKSRKDPASSDEEEIRIPNPRADLSRRIPPPPPKSVLPTYHDYTSNDLNEEGDEYTQTKFDDAGETKVDFLGYLRHNREYKCQTFRLPHRGKKLFMLAAECAEALSFRNSRILFLIHPPLHRMVASSVEKESMVEKHIIPLDRVHKDISFVSARSIFVQFGCRIIVNGCQFRDDYWERRAREEGYNEADIMNEQQASGLGPMTGMVMLEEKRLCHNCGTPTNPGLDEFGLSCNICGMYVEWHGLHRRMDLERNPGSGAGGSAPAYPFNHHPSMSGPSPMPGLSPIDGLSPTPGHSHLHHPQYTSWSNADIHDEVMHRDQSEDDRTETREVSSAIIERRPRPHQKGHGLNPDNPERGSAGNHALAFGRILTRQEKLQESVESRLKPRKSRNSSAIRKSRHKMGKVREEAPVTSEEAATTTKEQERSNPAWTRLDKGHVKNKP